MVERARANVAELAFSWAQVREAPAEATGLPDACADWVVVNGLLNLTPDKASVLTEIARVLKPEGELLLAETTLRAPLPDTAIETVDDWFR
ncbi:MAG: methyltransferase domain-containing protein, partial [Chloroflexota bacterium]